VLSVALAISRVSGIPPEDVKVPPVDVSVVPAIDAGVVAPKVPLKAPATVEENVAAPVTPSVELKLPVVAEHLREWWHLRLCHLWYRH
jgi:hypothetical protein